MDVLTWRSEVEPRRIMGLHRSHEDAVTSSVASASVGFGIKYPNTSHDRVNTCRSPGGRRQV